MAEATSVAGGDAQAEVFSGGDAPSGHVASEVFLTGRRQPFQGSEWLPGALRRGGGR